MQGGRPWPPGLASRQPAGSLGNSVLEAGKAVAEAADHRAVAAQHAPEFLRAHLRNVVHRDIGFAGPFLDVGQVHFPVRLKVSKPVAVRSRNDVDFLLFVDQGVLDNALESTRHLHRRHQR